ncbi:MAG TPA: exo-beta-N-acetylmuramidase NamZ domain-containing protein [Opitutus sp.]|nr:exo-beta-N-acetylmuramidase NamZ domain-containing protein [Opitutus sp.]
MVVKRSHDFWHRAAILLVFLTGLFGCSASQPPAIRVAAAPATGVALAPARPPLTQSPVVFPVMLGIDVLESQGFAALKGKRIGLLTHPAGVNRRGESTIDVLRHAPGVNLVALYGVEHGIYGELPAEKIYPDQVDPRTGLMIHSLYNGRSHKPTRAQLRGIDALVVDLQDIGTRSYTFVSAMKLAMEACFENNKEIIVLDRPNPLGGLKVDGPPLDAGLVSYVGEFRVPYVHGLTIGELALMAKEAPGVLDVSDEVRARGRLTVVPMRGWRRSMRWPDTGLKWIPTSPFIPDFSAVEGYPMVGLGCYIGGFQHGVGREYPFRGLAHKTARLEVVEKELRALELPGIQFRRVSVPNRQGKPAVGLYIEITDYDEWQPTELNFFLMKLACKLEPMNPFVTAPASVQNLFLKHMGSAAFLRALQHDGARTDIAAFIADWRQRALIYQQQSRRYWLYQ